MKIKLQDIANELNISVAAVSMAINGKKGVSDQTRIQVLELAEKYGYEIKKKTETLNERTPVFIKLLRVKKEGLVAQDTAFFSKLIEGIENETKKMDCQLVVSNMTCNEMDDDWLKSENSSSMDGLVILGTELKSDDLEILDKLNKPFVILDSYVMGKDWDSILMNNQQAVYKGVTHLLQNGHKQIGYLRSSYSIYNFDERYRSYQQFVHESKILQKPSHIIEVEPTLAGAYRDMLVYLDTIDGRLDQLPSAFMADNDLIAIGVMNALMEKGIKIPDQVSIVGIDDMPCGRIVTPKLTTVRIYKKKIGGFAVDRLLTLCKDPTDISRKVEINTFLIERESVKEL